MSNHARTKHTQFTVEAFSELVEQAREELVDNADVYEVHDLMTWWKALKRKIGQVSDHQTSSEPAPLGVFLDTEN